MYDIKMGFEEVHIPGFAKKFCFCETAEIPLHFCIELFFLI